MIEEKSEEEALKKVIIEAAETFALIHKIFVEISAAYGELKSKEEARKGIMEAEEAYREMFKTHIDTLIAYGKLKGKEEVFVLWENGISLVEAKEKLKNG